MFKMSSPKRIAVPLFAFLVVASLACSVTGMPTQVPPSTQVVPVTRIVTVAATYTPSQPANAPLCPNAEIVNVPLTGSATSPVCRSVWRFLANRSVIWRGPASRLSSGYWPVDGLQEYT